MAGISGVTLFEDETIVHRTKPAWMAYRWSLLIGLCTCWLLVGLWPLWRAWRSRSTTVYAVTTDRVIRRSGRRTVNVDDYRISDIAKIRTQSKRVWLIGSLDSVVFDIRHGETVSLDGVGDASQFVSAIREQQTT